MNLVAEPGRPGSVAGALAFVRGLAPSAATCGGRLPLTSGHYILRLLEIPDSLVGGLCGNGLGVVIQDNFEVLFN